MQFFFDYLLHRVMADWPVILFAARGWLAGRNPYLLSPYASDGIATGGMPRVFNPIWMLVFVMPYALLPDSWQPLLVFISIYAAVILITRKLKFTRLQLFLALTSPFVIELTMSGNIDWLAWLGLVFPTPAALVFLAIKPQTTWLVMLILVLKEYKQEGWHRVVKCVAPVTALGLIWIVGWGIHRPGGLDPGNLSFWPYSLILGIPIGIYAVWKQSVRFGALAGPFLTPYLSSSSYIALVWAAPIWSWVFGVVVLAAYRLAGK